MGGLALIVDSGAGFSKRWYEQHNVLVAQHSFAFPNESAVNDLSVSPAEFFARLKAAERPPSTAAPNPHQFTQLYNTAFASADKVLVLTMMREKSSVYNAALIASSNHPRSGDIRVLDSHTVGPAQGFIALEARRYFEGKGFEGIDQHVERLSQQAKVYMVPHDLSHLASTGRVAQAEKLAASPINLTAVISIVKLSEQGGYDSVPMSRHRTQQQALDQVAEYVRKDAEEFSNKGLNAVDFAVVHADNEAVAKALESTIQGLLGSFGFVANTVTTNSMSPVLGRQFGPRTVGVAMLYRTS